MQVESEVNGSDIFGGCRNGSLHIRIGRLLEYPSEDCYISENDRSLDVCFSNKDLRAVNLEIFWLVTGEMKRHFRFAISIVVVMFLIHNGNVGNSFIYAQQATSDKKVVEKMFAAWNSQDTDKVVAYFSEDGVYEDVTAGHISRGRAEVRKWVKGTSDVIENFKLAVVSNSLHKGHGVVEWVWSGTDKGLFKTGKKFSVRGVSIYEIRGGKISRYKEFYDFATVLKQVGLLPAEKE